MAPVFPAPSGQVLHGQDSLRRDRKRKRRTRALTRYTRERAGGGGVPVYQAKVPYDPDARRPWRTMPFPQSEYERRITAVQARLKAEGLAALVAYSNGADPGNGRYLVNFETSAGDTVVVIPASGPPMLTTNWLMHGEPMHTMIWTAWLDDVRGAERPGFVRSPETSVAGHAADRIQEAGAAADRIGVAGGPIVPHHVMVADRKSVV